MIKQSQGSDFNRGKKEGKNVTEFLFFASLSIAFVAFVINSNFDQDPACAKVYDEPTYNKAENMDGQIFHYDKCVDDKNSNSR